MKHYSVKEVAAALEVNPRAVQKRCVRANLNMTKGVYRIPEYIFEKWVAKKERTSKMTLIRPSTLEKENYVRSQELGRPDYASIVKRPKEENPLQKEIESLRNVIKEHNKLFRIMAAKIEGIGVKELEQVKETIEEKLPEPPLQVYKSVHPPNAEETHKSGVRVPKPSMNQIDFESSYNPDWNKDKE